MEPKVLSPTTPAAFVPAARPAIGAFEVRFSLDPRFRRQAAVDGAWWPYSTDAATQLPRLIVAVDGRLGCATLRVGLNVDAWRNIPRRIPARGRLVMVDRLTSIAPGVISLALAGAEPITFLVIPPCTGGSVARKVLHFAVDPEAPGIFAAL